MGASVPAYLVPDLVHEQILGSVDLLSHHYLPLPGFRGPMLPPMQDTEGVEGQGH